MLPRFGTRHVPIAAESPEPSGRLFRLPAVADSGFGLLACLFASYEYLTELIQDERTTIRRLRELLHGAKPKTEKTKNMVGQAAEPGPPLQELSHLRDHPVGGVAVVTSATSMAVYSRSGDGAAAHVGLWRALARVRVTRAPARRSAGRRGRRRGAAVGRSRNDHC